jgi:hypothetical protein
VPVVSVVGASGVGKSTFVRLCVKEGHPKPFSAPPKSATSTSADIHAYIGRLPTEKQLDVLLLDSEGNLQRKKLKLVQYQTNYIQAHMELMPLKPWHQTTKHKLIQFSGEKL